MLSLLSVVSTFSAAYELLANDADPAPAAHRNDDNAKPCSLLVPISLLSLSSFARLHFDSKDLLERISFINDDHGIRRLLSYEHTHTTGLR